MELYLELEGDTLKIEIEDEGQGIDYDIRSYDPGDLKCCGRGLVLVDGLSDKFYIEKKQSRSSKVYMLNGREYAPCH